MAKDPASFAIQVFLIALHIVLFGTYFYRVFTGKPTSIKRVYYSSYKNWGAPKKCPECGTRLKKEYPKVETDPHLEDQIRADLKFIEDFKAYNKLLHIYCPYCSYEYADERVSDKVNPRRA